MKKTYEMNGKTYKTLTAIAKDLGVSRLYAKDFAKYGVKEVTENDAATQSVATTDTAVATVTTTDTAIILATTNDANDKATDETVNDTTDDVVDTDTTVTATTGTTVTTATVDPVEELEKDVVDLTFDEFGKRLKKIDNNGILKMTQNIQGNTWDEISDPRIKRMRMIMEIKAAYYPDNVKKSVSTKAGKKASPWKAISTDDLVKVAADKKLTYKDCDDPQIKRMRVIMALKAAGVTAESLTK